MHVVSRSSSEAACCALANVTCKAQWLFYLLQGLWITYTNPITLYCDNKSTAYCQQLDIPQMNKAHSNGLSCTPRQGWSQPDPLDVNIYTPTNHIYLYQSASG